MEHGNHKETKLDENLLLLASLWNDLPEPVQQAIVTLAQNAVTQPR